MGGSRTHYQILDVSPQASVQQIREAFRTKAKLYHPDRAPAGSEEQFHLVQAAYEVLCDPGSRRAYDALLRSRRSSARHRKPASPTARSTAPDASPERRSHASALDEFLRMFVGSEPDPGREFRARRRPAVDPSYSDEGTDAGRYKDLDRDDADYDIYLSAAEAASGVNATLATEWGERVDVEIPAGVYHSEILTVRYLAGRRPGSLRLLIHVR